jgi:hypothetical protein
MAGVNGLVLNTGVVVNAPRFVVGISSWIERNIVLPETVADPGPVKLWPWQRERGRQGDCSSRN